MNFLPKAKALAPKLAIWELKDIPIPSIIIDNINKGWVDAGTYYGFADANYNIAFRGKSINLLQDDEDYKSKATAHIQSEITDFLLSQTDFDISDTWPTGLFTERIERNRKGCFDIWKDTPAVKQDIHLDNNFIMATVIINIKDNGEGSGTKYYLEKDIPLHPYGGFDKAAQVKPFYEAPYKMGTGTLHINTREMWHKGWNNSKEERCVMVNNFQV
jgi:hypothetical protein